MLDLDGDGEVTTNDLDLMLYKVDEVLQFQLPSSLGFTAGLLSGIGFSRRQLLVTGGALTALRMVFVRRAMLGFLSSTGGVTVSVKVMPPILEQPGLGGKTQTLEPSLDAERERQLKKDLEGEGHRGTHTLDDDVISFLCHFWVSAPGNQFL